MKPFHKHIGRRVARYHRHFTKYLYERDTIFATLWVFVFIIVLGSIPINFYVLNPLKLALKDFDFNDMTYLKQGKEVIGSSGKSHLDSNIVIINIGKANRQELSMIIDKTAEYKPKVMALDVLFEAPKDEVSDSMMSATVQRNKNLILINRIDWEDSVQPVKGQYFSEQATNLGYGNLVGDSKEEKKSIRLYSPFEIIHGDTLNSFSSAIVRLYDVSAYKKLKDRHKQLEIIRYTRHTNQYRIIGAEQLMLGEFEPYLIEGKIALLGYISESPYDIEDKVFTPMNERLVGKTLPDMNGIVVHANFISMVLEKNYVKKLPSWVNWLVAILICWLHMSFFVRYYLENHIWFHLVAKIAQLASAFIFAYLGMLLFERFNIKLDMKMSLIVIVMAVDVIYFYEAFAVWMH